MGVITNIIAVIMIMSVNIVTAVTDATSTLAGRSKINTFTITYAAR